MSDPLVLALDTGSPQLSVALGRGGEIVAHRVHQGRHAGELLLQLIDEMLHEVSVDRRELGGILALHGPGSFTGLRIGLATSLALAQALRIPATALPTLRVLASTVETSATETVLAAVDALRGEWFVQPFAGGVAVADAERRPLDSLTALAPAHLVGFGIRHAFEDLQPVGFQFSEPPPLAVAALRLQHRHPLAKPWDSTLLTTPLYLRAPNIRLPSPKQGEVR